MTDKITDARERFALLNDLFATGEEILRQNLRRKHPDASDAQIEELLFKWYADRPMPEGQRVPWPRPRRGEPVESQP